MEFWHGFLLITGIHLLAAASPGPDFIFVSQQTLSRGRRQVWCVPWGCAGLGHPHCLFRFGDGRADCAGGMAAHGH